MTEVPIAETVSIPGTPPGVRCWHATLVTEAAALPALEALLSAAELQRAERFGTPVLRARYVAGRAALRSVLGSVLGVAPGSVPIVRGARGRPGLPGETRLDFNVSHTRGLALIAVSDCGRVGVDLEHEDRQVNADGLARRVLAQRERDRLAAFDDETRRRSFLRLWTCKEAMSKATGDGLSAPFRRIGIDLDSLDVAEGPAPYAPGDWRLHALATRARYLATLAVWIAAS